MTEEKLYIGMDIGKNHVLVSCFTEGNREPETLSTIAGSEQYQIPMALYKKRGIGQWYFGREALERQNADAGGGTLIQDLWEQAKAGSVIRIEDVDYRAMDLLAVFFRKVLMLPRRYKGADEDPSAGTYRGRPGRGKSKDAERDHGKNWGSRRNSFL